MLSDRLSICRIGPSIARLALRAANVGPIKTANAATISESIGIQSILFVFPFFKAYAKLSRAGHERNPKAAVGSRRRLERLVGQTYTKRT